MFFLPLWPNLPVMTSFTLWWVTVMSNLTHLFQWPSSSSFPPSCLPVSCTVCMAMTPIQGLHSTQVQIRPLQQIPERQQGSLYTGHYCILREGDKSLGLSQHISERFVATSSMFYEIRPPLFPTLSFSIDLILKFKI